MFSVAVGWVARKGMWSLNHIYGKTWCLCHRCIRWKFAG